MGYMVYLIDDKYLLTGGIIWFGSDGGDSFISALAEDNRLAVQSLAAFEEKLRSCGLHPKFITGHTRWADNMDFDFAHKDKLCSPIKKRVPDPTALYDAYDEEKPVLSKFSLSMHFLIIMDTTFLSIST